MSAGEKAFPRTMQTPMCSRSALAVAGRSMAATGTSRFLRSLASASPTPRLAPKIRTGRILSPSSRRGEFGFKHAKALDLVGLEPAVLVPADKDLEHGLAVGVEELSR